MPDETKATDKASSADAGKHGFLEFWKTLPGILTAVALVVTAATGLLSVLATSHVWVFAQAGGTGGAGADPSDASRYPAYPGPVGPGDTGADVLVW